jgi:hypothetical protein
VVHLVGAAAAYSIDPANMFKHGTTGGYSNHHCRCAECRRANAEQTKRRYELYAQEGGRGQHGTYYRYKTGCRCASCRAASASYSAAYKRRRREATNASHETGSQNA